jgi:hypothetical protein
MKGVKKVKHHPEIRNAQQIDQLRALLCWRRKRRKISGSTVATEFLVLFEFLKTFVWLIRFIASRYLTRTIIPCKNA